MLLSGLIEGAPPAVNCVALSSSSAASTVAAPDAEVFVSFDFTLLPSCGPPTLLV
ncbi:MAG: hypothetical protein JWN25_1944 [Verrucomicrobiales bacterium]|nr:hypothetical protein [Verrucomicrobiales bacterium]